VLRSPDTFHYAVHHQLALYRDLLGDVPIALCALDDSDLADPTYREERAPLAIPMPWPPFDGSRESLRRSRRAPSLPRACAPELLSVVRGDIFAGRSTCP
jgi:hypothetical protein